MPDETRRPCNGPIYRYETPRTSSPAQTSVPQLSGVQPGGSLGNRLIPVCEPSPSSPLQAVDLLRARYFGSVPCVPSSGLYSRTTEVAKASSGSGLPEPERTDLETHSQCEVLQTPGPASSEEEQASRRLFQPEKKLCHQTTKGSEAGAGTRPPSPKSPESKSANETQLSPPASPEPGE